MASWVLYDSARANIGGSIDLNAHTLKAKLLSASYTPSVAHTQLSDVSAYSIGTDQVLVTSTQGAGGGYGTLVLGEKATWSSVDVPQYVAVYDDSEASDALVCYLDFGGTIDVPSGGLLSLAPGAMTTAASIVPAAGGQNLTPGLASVSVTGYAPSILFFYDGFESGDTASPNNGSWYTLTSNANGTTPFVSNTNPDVGTYALRFIHAATPSGSDSNSEARFSTDSALNELWWEWRMYIPSNYAHRADSPSNNKFWIIGYNNKLHGGWSETGGWTVRMELRPATGDDISKSRLVYGNETSGASSENANGTGPTMSQYNSVITTSDLGTWVTFGVHLKLGTTIAAEDADVHFYKNGSLVLTNEGFPIAGTSTTNPADSYELVGWANSGYAAETIFDIDEVKVHTNNPGW